MAPLSGAILARPDGRCTRCFRAVGLHVGMRLRHGVTLPCRHSAVRVLASLVRRGHCAAQAAQAVPFFMYFEGLSICPSVPMHFSQASIVKTFARLFPPDIFAGFSWPWVEDILNSPPFLLYFEWRQREQESLSCPMGPNIMQPGLVRYAARCGEGIQQGVVSSKRALPPLVPHNLSPDEHFSRALRSGNKEIETYTNHDQEHF